MLLHIGIFPPKETLDKLRDINRGFSKFKRNLKPIPTDQMHITLKNIGATVSPSSKDAIIEGLRAYNNTFGGIKIKFTKLKFGFIKESFPKILNLEVEATKELLELSENLHEIIKSFALQDTMIWKETKFKDFFVDLAKIKTNATLSTAKILKDFTKTFEFEPVESFTAKDIYVFETQSLPDNKIFYRKIERIEL